jgi:hypothetical protein
MDQSNGEGEMRLKAWSVISHKSALSVKSATRLANASLGESLMAYLALQPGHSFVVSAGECEVMDISDHDRQIKRYAAVVSVGVIARGECGKSIPKCRRCKGLGVDPKSGAEMSNCSHCLGSGYLWPKKRARKGGDAFGQEKARQEGQGQARYRTKAVKGSPRQ